MFYLGIISQLYWKDIEERKLGSEWAIKTPLYVFDLTVEPILLGRNHDKR